MDYRTGRVIEAEMLVPAPAHDVWLAWTTEPGAQTFFAPQCNIDLRVGRAYEMLFDLQAEPGSRGGEGMILLALQPEEMLSFTWNAPPHLVTVRGQMTHVTVRIESIAENQTHVCLRHDGWGRGGEWDLAFEYFSRAWPQMVLPRLRYRFEHAPVNWASLPEFPGKS